MRTAHQRDSHATGPSHEALISVEESTLEEAPKRRSRRRSKARLGRRNARRVPTAVRVRTFARLFSRLLRWFRPLLGASLCFLLGLHAWKRFHNSPMFGLKTIVYPSQPQLPQAELLKFAGLKKGDNLLTLDLQQLSKKLEAHPQIKSVKLRRSLPSKLEIRVETHKPVAIARLGHKYYVDAKGRAFARVPKGRDAGYLQISGIQRAEYQRDPKVAQQVFVQALSLARMYRQKQLHQYQKLHEIQYDPVLGYILRTEAGRMYLGDKKLPNKIKQLHRIYRLFWQRGVRKIRYVYLNHRRHPRRAIVRTGDAILVREPASKGRKPKLQRALQKDVSDSKPRMIRTSTQD